MSRIAGKIGNRLKTVVNFFNALDQAKKQPAPPDARREITRTLMDASHVAHSGGSGTGGSGTGNHASGEKILVVRR